MNFSRVLSNPLHFLGLFSSKNYTITTRVVTKPKRADQGPFALGLIGKLEDGRYLPVDNYL